MTTKSIRGSRALRNAEYFSEEPLAAPHPYWPKHVMEKMTFGHLLDLKRAGHSSRTTELSHAAKKTRRPILDKGAFGGVSVPVGTEEID